MISYSIYIADALKFFKWVLELNEYEKYTNCTFDPKCNEPIEEFQGNFQMPKKQEIKVIYKKTEKARSQGHTQQN